LVRTRSTASLTSPAENGTRWNTSLPVLEVGPWAWSQTARSSGTGTSGQAPRRTPARLESEGRQLLNCPHTPAEGQAEAGTIAAKVTGRSSQPLTTWLTLTNTFVPTGGTPYRAVYRLVMSAEPCTGAGQAPSTRKSVNFPKPWLTAFEPRTMVVWPGSVGQVSFSVIKPTSLAMTRFCGPSTGNCGRAGGASTWVWPNSASVQLILLNNCWPVSGPLWPRRLTLLTPLPAAVQAARWASWSARQRAVTRVRIARTLICEAVRGLDGMTKARLIWPYRPPCDTYRPRLPDCGMSSIFIRYFLSLFVCLVKRRASPAEPANFRAPKVSCGRDAFHRVPIIEGEVRDAVKRVLTVLMGNCPPWQPRILQGVLVTVCMAISSCARPHGRAPFPAR